MSIITFVDSRGTAFEISTSSSQSVMQLALDHSVPGILAECKGACSCATCHVYIDAPWAEQFPAPSESEAFLLEMVIEPTPQSRLACQLKLNNTLAGLVVRIPKEQI
jgi:ferredoxin, 2Fe-2S